MLMAEIRTVTLNCTKASSITNRTVESKVC